MPRTSPDTRTAAEILMAAGRLYLFSEDPTTPAFGDGRVDANMRVLDALYLAQQLAERTLANTSDREAYELADTFLRGQVPDYTDEKPSDGINLLDEPRGTRQIVCKRGSRRRPETLEFP